MVPLLSGVPEEMSKQIDDCLDLTSCSTLEITYNRNHPDGARLWIHCDGKMIVRIYRIGNLFIEDRDDFKLRTQE